MNLSVQIRPRDILACCCDAKQTTNNTCDNNVVWCTGIWGPHLIVVPTSVMLNWEMELKKWCPAFKILTYYGTMKERKLKRQVRYCLHFVMMVQVICCCFRCVPFRLVFIVLKCLSMPNSWSVFEMHFHLRLSKLKRDKKKRRRKERRINPAELKIAAAFRGKVVSLREKNYVPWIGKKTMCLASAWLPVFCCHGYLLISYSDRCVSCYLIIS